MVAQDERQEPAATPLLLPGLFYFFKKEYPSESHELVMVYYLCLNFCTLTSYFYLLLLAS